MAHAELLAVLDDYLAALYAGDVACLRSVFHPSAVLWGRVKGQPYHKLLDEYLQLVQERKSPQSLGEAFTMQVLSIEVQGDTAFAKVRCPMLGFDYLDFLSLVENQGSWSIVSKVFTT